MTVKSAFVFLTTVSLVMQVVEGNKDKIGGDGAGDCLPAFVYHIKISK